MIVENAMLLDTYLKKLRLPTFLHNYAKFAEDAARGNLSYDRYLLAQLWPSKRSHNGRRTGRHGGSRRRASR